MPLSEFITFWLENIVSHECKKSTLDGYKSIVNNHIIPLLGMRNLDTLTLMDSFKFRTNVIEKGLSTNTVNRIINCFKIILNHAVKLQYLEVNPLADLKFIEDNNNKINTLSDSEIDAIRSSHLPHKDLYMFALYTGLRIGEIATLTPNDVNINGRYISVTRTATRFGDTTPKSNKCREVPLINNALNIVKERMNQEKLFDIDFSNFTSYHMSKDCAKLGLRKLRFHDLRHTFATKYLANGGDITHLSMILGHSSVKITQDIYVHLDVNNLLTNIQGVNFGF